LGYCVCFYHAARLTLLGSRCSAHAARFTLLGSRCSAHAARFTLLGSRCSAHAARLTLLGSRCSAHAARLTLLGSRCSVQAARLTLLSQWLCSALLPLPYRSAYTAVARRVEASRPHRSRSEQPCAKCGPAPTPDRGTERSAGVCRGTMPSNAAPKYFGSAKTFQCSSVRPPLLDQKSARPMLQ
jgi:hypothetical protein